MKPKSFLIASVICIFIFFVFCVCSLHSYWFDYKYTPIQLLREDLARLEAEEDQEKKEMVVITFAGSEDLWGQAAGDLRRLVASGAVITFIVGPHFVGSENPAICELSDLDGVYLYMVPEMSRRLEIRIIGKKHLHIAYEVDAENCWRSWPKGAPRKELRAAENFVERLLSQAEPYSWPT